MNKMIKFEKKQELARLAHAMPMLAAATLGSLMLAACASTPKPPDQAMELAQASITTAEQARVADYASPELGEAREKLAAAHNAVQGKNMVLAERLAEESRVDADLAIAKAGIGKANVVNDEMKKSTDTIKTEMQRNPGVQP